MAEEKKHNNSDWNPSNKKNPFDTPDGYFDSLTDRIMDRIEEQQTPVKKPFFYHLKPVIGLAASFLLIALLLYVPMRRYMPDIWENYYSKHESANQDAVDEWEYIIADMDAVAYFSGTEVSDDQNEEATEELQYEDEELLNYLVAELDDYDLLFAEL